MNVQDKVCGNCKRKGKEGRLVLHIWDKRLNRYVKYDQGNTEAGAASAKKTNKFAEFVKENYKFSRTPGRSHGDAMKELGKMFAETKIDRH